MHPALRPRPVLLGLLLLAATWRADAQQRPAPRLDADCDYRRCAYALVAAPSGLRVVQGEEEAPVATLGFLFTRDISGAFDGAARDVARAAVRTRRWAAFLTDAGLLLLAAGAVQAATNDLDDTSARLMLAGAASVGVSVPLQFRADNQLSRAVFAHNARFAREAR